MNRINLSSIDLDTYTQPVKSNAFHDIVSGDLSGILNIYCDTLSAFEYITHYGEMNTGSLTVGSDTRLKSLTVSQNTILDVDESLTIAGANVNIHGTLRLKDNSSLILNRGSKLILYSDSTLVIPDSVQIHIENGSSIVIYGQIDVALANINTITSNPNIVIDTAAVTNVTGIPYENREFSLTDYVYSIRDLEINPHTQGEHNSGISRIGFTWVAGSVPTDSKVLDMEVLWGRVILGDFKFSVLGNQKEIIKGRTIIRNLKINKGTSLFVQEEFEGYKYLHPELYLGIVIGNSESAGECLCYGDMTVSGENSRLVIDRGSLMYVGTGGTLSISDDASIITSHQSDTISLYIDGTVIIDYIEQLQGFIPESIEFGENGKLVILNKYPDEHKVLWSTPIQLPSTELYRLFSKRLDHVEYHIQANTGIAIDQNFYRYNVDFRTWYNNMRIEKAIKEGQIVWHSGAFIELRHDIIPWISCECTLFDIASIFKSYGVTKEERLQNVADHFKYAGAGNITFRFIESENVYKDIQLVLDDVTIESIMNVPDSNGYVLDVDNSGDLFMRNKISSATVDTIISPDSKQYHLPSKGSIVIDLQ